MWLNPQQGLRRGPLYFLVSRRSGGAEVPTLVAPLSPSLHSSGPEKKQTPPRPSHGLTPDWAWNDGLWWGLRKRACTGVCKESHKLSHGQTHRHPRACTDTLTSAHVQAPCPDTGPQSDSRRRHPATLPETPTTPHPQPSLDVESTWPGALYVVALSRFLLMG